MHLIFVFKQRCVNPYKSRNHSDGKFSTAQFASNKIERFVGFIDQDIEGSITSGSWRDMAVPNIIPLEFAPPSIRIVPQKLKKKSSPIILMVLAKYFGNGM